VYINQSQRVIFVRVYKLRAYRWMETTL